jgi:four helix bundle protein
LWSLEPTLRLHVMNHIMKTKAPAQSFEDVAAWQKAHSFVLSVYQFTENFPRKEIYGLTSQFRRAAISVPANIAEGFKKSSLLDKVRFYNIAQGSLEECRYYLILSRDLNYGDTAALFPQLEEASKLLNAYASALRRKTFIARGIVVYCLVVPIFLL